MGRGRRRTISGLLTIGGDVSVSTLARVMDGVRSLADTGVVGADVLAGVERMAGLSRR